MLTECFRVLAFVTLVLAVGSRFWHQPLLRELAVSFFIVTVCVLALRAASHLISRKHP